VAAEQIAFVEAFDPASNPEFKRLSCRTFPEKV
jgi:hypothetical protein